MWEGIVFCYYYVFYCYERFGIGVIIINSDDDDKNILVILFLVEYFFFVVIKSFG